MLGKVFSSTSATNTYDFAIEEIMSENNQNKEIDISQIKNIDTLTKNEKESLHEIGSRIIHEINSTQTIILYFNKMDNKYYKWISEKE